MRESVGYTFFNDGRVYQGTYKNDEEHGIGEWMSNAPKMPKNIMKIDY